MSSERNRYRFVQTLSASALVAVFATPQSLVAEVNDHLVSTSDLQQAAVNASQQRQQNLETLRAFLGTDKARQAMRSAHFNPDEVNKAVSSLTDDELAQLAKRATKAQADFAAGSLSDRDLLVLLIAIVALILIIVAVR